MKHSSFTTHRQPLAYKERPAARVRGHQSGNPPYSERRMFGGICYLLNGGRCAGLLTDELIVRVPADEYPAALACPHARVFDSTGRPIPR